MKILIILLVSIIIMIKSYIPPNEPCNLFTAYQAIPPRIFAETTIDGKDQNPLVTRYFHNKAGIVLSEFSKCYFSILDPLFFFESTSIVGMLAILFLIYKTFMQKKLLVLIPLLILPVLPFFNFPLMTVVFVYKLFAIIGVVFWLYFR